MSSGLRSAPSEVTKRSEFAKDPVVESATEPLLRSIRLKLTTGASAWIGNLASLTFPRYLLAFLVGIVATLAWQSYSDAARTTIAAWSPHLAWVAPAAALTSRQQIKATSLALTTVRQSVDKLATEVSKLETQVAEGAASQPSRRASRGR